MTGLFARPSAFDPARTFAMTPGHSPHLPRSRAFTLLEILIVISIIAVALSAIITSETERALRHRIDLEDRALTDLSKTIQESFESEDFSGTNIAAFSSSFGGGDIDGTVSPTRFSNSTAGHSAVTAQDWFAKVARLRSATFTTGGALTRSGQPEVAKIALNSMDNPRWLFAAPPEAERQRFLLVSLMARNEQLTMPAYSAASDWFDAIWNTDFDTRTMSTPPLWNSLLTGTQLNEWNNGSRGSMLWRLRVQKITLRRYTMVISNTHGSDSAWVRFNNAAHFLNSAANSGSMAGVPAVLGGRMVKVYVGTTEGTAVLKNSFRLHDNAEIIIQ